MLTYLSEKYVGSTLAGFLKQVGKLVEEGKPELAVKIVKDINELFEQHPLEKPIVLPTSFTGKLRWFLKNHRDIDVYQPPPLWVHLVLEERAKFYNTDSYNENT